jgi:hypothetical protein
MAKIETLKDTFDTAINPAVWGTYGQVSVESGRLRMNSITAYSGAYTQDRYDLRESAVAVQIAPAPFAPSREFSVTVTSITGDGALMAITGQYGTLFMRRKQSGNTDSYGDYNPADVWFRIRMTGTTLYWETSPNGFTWTTQWSATTSSDLSAVQLELSLGHWGTEVGEPPGYFDNVNTLPAATGWPKVWTGSAWTKKPAKVWTGSAWVQKPVKVWTGSAWKTVA